MGTACLGWQIEGRGSAEEVDAATNSYREEMDVIVVFLSEVCIVGGGESVEFRKLYDAYVRWCFDSGEKELTKRRFGAALTERGIPADRGTGNAPIRRGVTLDPEARVTNETSGAI